MDKVDFVDRLILAGKAATETAMNLEYVKESLPSEMVFTLSKFNDTNGARGPKGTIKFLGGRFLKAEELERLPASRAASLLWVDGKVPAWINIHVSNCNDIQTEFYLRFSRDVVRANVDNLPPDIGMMEGNLLVPFRIRGPSMEDWNARGKNA